LPGRRKLSTKSGENGENRATFSFGPSNPKRYHQLASCQERHAFRHIACARTYRTKHHTTLLGIALDHSFETALAQTPSPAGRLATRNTRERRALVPISLSRASGRFSLLFSANEPSGENVLKAVLTRPQVPATGVLKRVLSVPCDKAPVRVKCLLGL
jgi:hypothetical protein